MAAASGPNIVEDGLVLALDAGNAKSLTESFTEVESNVSLLLDGDDLTDSSSYAHTLSNTNIAVNTTTKKYGTGSLFFSTSAYGTFSHDSTFDIGTGDFTIEAWVYPQNSGTRGIAHNHPSFTGGGFTFWIGNDSKLRIQNFTNGSSSNSSITATTTTPNGTWAHVAYSRSGGTGYLFVNGNLEGTHTDSTNLTNNSAFYVGVAEGTNYKGIGYIDDLRFTVGEGRYTSSFTPPTAAFGTAWTDLTGSNNGTLVSMSGTNYNSANGGYLDFDGASDYVTLPFNTEYTNISIDAWATRDQLNVWNSILGKYGSGASNAGYELVFNNSGGVRFHTSSQSIDSTSLSADVWYHIVGTYDGSTARIYINGSLDVSGSTSRNTNTINWQIGRSAWGGNYHNGKISNIKIYNKALTAAEVKQNYDVLKGRFIN